MTKARAMSPWKTNKAIKKIQPCSPGIRPGQHASVGDGVHAAAAEPRRQRQRVVAHVPLRVLATPAATESRRAADHCQGHARPNTPR